MKGIQRTVRNRRRKGKTDYKARLGLLKSGQPRIVVRKTNRFILGQIVESHIAQDKILVGVSSKDLLKSGWPKEKIGSMKNLHACYLTGYLLGKKSKTVKSGILDMGLQRSVKNSRIYSFLKGLKDSGFEVSCSNEVMPSEETMVKNEEMHKLLNTIMEKIK